MAKIIKNIPLLDLAAFVLETVESPKHVGALQIFEPVNGSSAEIVARVLQDYRASEVAPPFNYVPIFPTFGVPKWAECENRDPHYHVRQAGLPKPGTLTQLIDLVTDLHAGIMDRSRPCYMAYIIEGLENDCFAVYWKMHHAYIDGASAVPPCRGQPRNYPLCRCGHRCCNPLQSLLLQRRQHNVWATCARV